MAGVMRVAVVGAGIYGCTIAVDLAAAGHQVSIAERHDMILAGATRANQGRLHRGFHYPRSLATALNAWTDADAFEARYGDVLDRSHRHYYAVAAGGSKTGADKFVAFAERLGGRSVYPPPFLTGVAAVVAVDEPYIDTRRLRARLQRDLREAGVSVELDAPVLGADPADPPDLLVWATYGQPWPWQTLRYEVCEVALVELGQHLAGRGVVVMDGDFVSLDPVPGTNLHMLYDVRHSVHHAAVGAPEIPEHLAPLIDRSVIPTEHTHVEAMYATARRFIAGMGMSRYRGSMFTVRAVLDGADLTDERPVLIHKDFQTVWVLGGKLDGAVRTARRVVQIASDHAGAAVPA